MSNTWLPHKKSIDPHFLLSLLEGWSTDGGGQPALSVQRRMAYKSGVLNVGSHPFWEFMNLDARNTF